MTERFNKDAWILRALAKRHLVVKPDGSIWRFDKLEQVTPGHSRARFVRQVFSVHKKTGRVYFTLTFEGISKSVLVNRVVALALIPNPLNLPEVNHIDGVKAHNTPDNLEWSSRAEQERHAFATGLKSTRGSSNANAKLTAADVIKIREMPEANLEQLAITFNVSRKTIKDIRDRRTWRHV